ncbi:MAG: outer membrane lipoprotein-sorting protein [Bryocella sp.]
MKLAALITATSITLGAAALGTAAFAQKPPSPKLIQQLDASSRSFRSAQANVSKDNYTYVVRAHDMQSGTIFIERKGSTVAMGATVMDPGAQKPSKIVSFDGNTLQLYDVGTNSVDILKAGSNQAKYQSYLTLGFGGSGTELARAWNINDLGPETINGVSCEKLDLTPKDPSIARTFTHVTIWIDPVRDVSTKQIFYAPNKDTQTAIYSDIRLNAPINTKPFSIPSKATRNYR